MRDPTRAPTRLRLLFEDKHVPCARSLRLYEPGLATDRYDAEDALVEGERTFGVADLRN